MLTWSMHLHVLNILISSMYLNDIVAEYIYSKSHNYACADQYAHPKGGPVNTYRNSTKSILTTATLIYAIGAGITAAAGTRLALQSVLTKHVAFESC